MIEWIIFWLFLAAFAVAFLWCTFIINDSDSRQD